MTDTPRGPSTLAELMPYSQHTKRFDRARTLTYLEMFANWITSSNRLPASASLERLGRDTVVITVQLNPSDTPDGATDSAAPDA